MRGRPRDLSQDFTTDERSAHPTSDNRNERVTPWRNVADWPEDRTGDGGKARCIRGYGPPGGVLCVGQVCSQFGWLGQRATRPGSPPLAGSGAGI